MGNKLIFNGLPARTTRGLEGNALIYRKLIHLLPHLLRGSTLINWLVLNALPSRFKGRTCPEMRHRSNCETQRLDFLESTLQTLLSGPQAGLILGGSEKSPQ